MRLGRSRNPEIEINVTSLIDVVFLLLIFFMVATTFKQERDLDVTLPKTTQTGAVAPTERAAIEVVISTQGAYYLNESPLAGHGIEDLKQALADAAAGDQDLPVVIRADENTPLQAVVRVLDAASQIGLRHVRIPTEIDRSGR
jgi:biopolymer transport protein ExbD